MADTRTSFKGSISVDLLNIPITLANATKTIREKSIVQLCECHGLKIDGSHRCAKTGDKGPNKVMGVDMGDGTYRKLSANEWANIENATKDNSLEILDVQPISDLPTMFGSKTYYVRADKDNRSAAGGVAMLTLALAKMGAGAVVKWGKASGEDLCVIQPYKGLLVLTVVPFVEGLNIPGEQERSHMRVPANEGHVDKLVDLLKEIRNDDGFDYESYENEGLRLRQEAVDKILANEDFEDRKEEIKHEATDLMGDLMASLDARKVKVPA